MFLFSFLAETNSRLCIMPTYCINIVTVLVVSESRLLSRDRDCVFYFCICATKFVTQFETNTIWIVITLNMLHQLTLSSLLIDLCITVFCFAFEAGFVACIDVELCSFMIRNGTFCYIKQMYSVFT